ncbi:MAG: EamA family transporter RarD [Thiofilum sp.]|uniref:EamA family transporter RarD n=1 Tax=Thiofilum sp. TaxID=2212733 RepID=UPI0025DF5F92|nr:EamA family transporter RarD [Thiofilum sp.]MBK8454585.1 EamA family transporter RarD [Thiofilum sp.]
MPAQSQHLGLTYGLTAYIIWGLFPLYFHWLNQVSATQILTHRIIWCFVFVSLLIVLLNRRSILKTTLRNNHLLKGLFISSLLIATNWLIFIWSIGQGRVLESSLGYFLTPLVSVLLARIVLKESLDRYRWIAIVLALIGVGWQIFQLGHLPWISLSLAVSFGLYGLVRKQLPIDSLTGLWMETLFLLPLALLYWLWVSLQGNNQFLTQGIGRTLLLIASGAVTALPLILFAMAAQKLSLITLGFLIYINPTMQFLLAIFYFHQPLNSNQLISFGFIWAALSVFSYGAWRMQRNPLASIEKSV